MELNDAEREEALARLPEWRYDREAKDVFAGLPDSNDASGAAGGVPGSRKRLVIG